jgi:2-phosphosulfolactate phosphatase
MGSFVNLSAVAQAVAGAEQVDLLCAGTRGEITLEDSLCAAALRDRLMAQPVDWELNDQAWLLGCDELISAPSVPKDDELRSMAVAGLLRLSRGGRNLLKIGLESDIQTAAEVDRFDLIPELDLKDWRITI